MTTRDDQPRRKTILYARVSTLDQTSAHQTSQAEEAGFHIDEVVVDEGVSGITTPLADRQEGHRLFDMLRAGDTLVVRWLDTLGRSYSDVSDTIVELMERGVIIRTVVGDVTFDGRTKEPVAMAVQDALIAFMAATAQAQAEATREAQRAGIEHAKAAGDGRYKGRKPSYSRAELQMVQEMLSQAAAISAIAKATGLTRQTVYRIKYEPAVAEAALRAWDM